MNYDKAKELIKKFEGLSLKTYRCPAGVLTIGYGHTKNVKENQTITKKEAERLLEEDIQDCVKQINKLGLELNENQFNALISLVFNIGIGRFSKSTMLRLLKEKKYDEAAKEFDKWIYAGGKVLLGLVKRRELEKKLFLS